MQKPVPRRRSPEQTREDLVRAAVRLILRQGFAATRVDEICAEAGVTKGAFFHHFTTKDEIGEAAISWWGRMGGSAYAPAWGDEGGDPLERLHRMFDIMAGFTERPEPCVCVVGMMAQECAGVSEAFREAADRELAHWTGQVAGLLAEAKEVHPPADDFDPQQVAWFLNSLWQGSMLVSKTHRDPAMIRANLRIARDCVDGLFLPPPTPNLKNDMNARWMALGALMLCGGLRGAEEAPAMPEMPKPTEQHEWLQKLVGEWTIETEIHMEPGKEPMKATGTETARMLGGFWVVGEGRGEMEGMSTKWILTFGYDPQKEEYVGRWIDSMSSAKWDYTGQVDESGKVLTLKTRGFCPMEGKLCDFRTTVRFESDDRRVITDEKKTDDGWVTAVVSTYTRKH